VSDFYGQVRSTLLAADACLAPTAFLSERMRRCGKPAFVLPNGFDETTRRVSEAALAARRAAGEAPVQRIGYAGGTRTHQKDFAVIAAPVAAALREAASRRLVLFRRGTEACLDISEFPEFAGLEAQIEWREMVGLLELPWELARFDINLAPLELGNPYCEAKSELKFFEAALVGVPTIATPTQPFRDAIRDGENGLLAADPQAWSMHINDLLNNLKLRKQLAQASFADVHDRYGTNKRTETLLAIMRVLG
jgi:glycosyltransferase involved in cell wall biosynthesis